MRISAIKQTSSDIVEISTDGGSVFFVRFAFLDSVKPEDFFVGAEFF